jgi:DNA-binding GntR family transcriptional regulator
MQELTVDFSEFVQNGSQKSNDIDLDNMGRTKLSDYVIDYVVNNIMSGEYSPASRIDPKEISQQLSISQMPVRDALEKLEERGWIVKYPQRGTFIKKVSYSDLQEMYQVRTMIETEAIRNIIDNGTAEHFEQLQFFVDNNEEAIVSANLEKYEKYDTKFHRYIVESTGNSRIISMYNTVMSQTRYYFLVLIWSSDVVKKHNIMDLKNIPVSHKSLYEAICHNDKNEAGELIRIHLRKGIERYWQIAKMRNMTDNE